MSHLIIDIPNGTTVSGIPLSIARSMGSHLHPKNGWERNSTSMRPRYIVRHFDDQRGYYLLCNMVTLQSLRSFSLSVDKSNPINRCHGNGTLPRLPRSRFWVHLGRLTYCVCVDRDRDQHGTNRLNNMIRRSGSAFLNSPQTFFFPYSVRLTSEKYRWRFVNLSRLHPPLSPQHLVAGCPTSPSVDYCSSADRHDDPKSGHSCPQFSTQSTVRVQYGYTAQRRYKIKVACPTGVNYFIHMNNFVKVCGLTGVVTEV
jgi:hypothetical protein